MVFQALAPQRLRLAMMRLLKVSFLSNLSQSIVSQTISYSFHSFHPHHQ